MEHWDWTVREKPYDLRQRLFLFACRIVRVVQFLHTRGPVASALSYQLLKSGSSAGANWEEADDGSSHRDKLAKKRITLRELKETRWRLRVLRECTLLTAQQDPIIQESDEARAHRRHRDPQLRPGWTVRQSCDYAVPWELGVGSWQLAVGSCELGVGSWELAVGSWQLGIGSWQLGVPAIQRVKPLPDRCASPALRG
jgi:four helix bundle protein